MKQLLILLMASLMIITVNAQRATTLPLAAGDTAVNAGTASKVVTLTAAYQGVVVQAIVTKLSGTGAGTVGLWGSLDGTNYKQIGSDYTVTNVTTQSTMFYVTGPVPVFLKVLETGSGTMSCVLTVKYVARLR